MKKLVWCMSQKNGIELIEPNDNLCTAYFNEAKDTLTQIKGTGSKWEVIMGYYACYHALYALLMKAGIKCEIHECTLEVLSLIDGLTQKDFNFLSKLKKQRIDAQYYLKPEKLEDFLAVKKFVLKCQEIAESLDVQLLRRKLDEARK